MLKAFFRLLSLTSLAAALVAAVLDMTRSIANSRMVLTPLSADWAHLSNNSLSSVRDFMLGKLPGFVWDPIFTSVLSTPTWVVFGFCAIAFGMLARQRRRRWQENFE
jgi:hypothetical protein